MTAGVVGMLTAEGGNVLTAIGTWLLVFTELSIGFLNKIIN
jgi:hypothetical protein